MLAKVMLVLFSLACASASAQQMFKCTTPAGKVEYRGSPCEGASREAPMGRGSVSGIDAMPQHEIDSTLSSGQRQRARSYASPAAPAAARRPTEQEIRNLETAASSTTISAEERRRRQLELDVARERATGGTGQNAMDLAAAAESDRRARSRSRAAAAADRSPTMASCDAGGCWDSNGGRYNKGAGNTFTRQDGKFCTSFNGQMTCN